MRFNDNAEMLGATGDFNDFNAKLSRLRAVVSDIMPKL